MSEDILNSSGNAFTDLGFPPDDAAILQMRADLMAELRKVIKARKLTQAKAAKILGVSQSRVSDLVRGKWEKFSLEMLITLATRAGLHVTIKTAAYALPASPTADGARSPHHTTAHQPPTLGNTDPQYLLQP